MTIRYNIALVPTKESKSIIKYAQFFSIIADSYLLGKNSLPHVTLYQFQTTKSEIKSIWGKICSKLDRTLIELKFEEFSCITFDKQTYWISILPNNRDALNTMHNIVSHTINQPTKPNYDPHMTLINTKNSSYTNLVNELSKVYIPIQDSFVLALGISDEIGQFKEVIYSHTANL